MIKTTAMLNGNPEHTLMQECADRCARCHQVCLETIKYSLRLGGRYSESVHLRLLLDCGEICQTSANFMLRGSDLHRETCRTCAVICKECATDCERYAAPGEDAGAPMSRHSGLLGVSKENVDEQMRYCAEVCRTCAKSCQGMAEMPLHDQAP